MDSYAQLVLDPESARTENEEEPLRTAPAGAARGARSSAIAVLGASLLLVAGVVAWGTPKASGVLQGSMSSLISEEGTCSGHGQDCRDSRCCEHEGSKCFKKNDHWAACNSTCDANMIWDHDSQEWKSSSATVWDCSDLTCPGGGVDDGADCRDTKCCKSVNSQCFKKNDHWASCNATCDSKKVWNTSTNSWDHTPSHIWDCAVLTPGGGDAGDKDDAGDGETAGADAGDEGSEAGGDAGEKDAGGEESNDAGGEESEDSAGEEGAEDAGDVREDATDEESKDATGEEDAAGEESKDAGGEESEEDAGEEGAEDAGDVREDATDEESKDATGEEDAAGEESKDAAGEEGEDATGEESEDAAGEESKDATDEESKDAGNETGESTTGMDGEEEDDAGSEEADTDADSEVVEK